MPLFSEIGFNALRWIVDGSYETGEIHIVKQTIEKEDRVLEIGTGLGFVTTFCANATDSSQVITFEANPMNMFISKQVFEKNGVNPTCRNAFLSNTDAPVLFYVQKTNRLASSMNLTGGQTVEIPSLDLNKIIKDFSPTYLIMDIEGGEYEIFSLIDFQTIHKIQFELHPTILGQTKCDEIFNLLRANHFSMNEKLSAMPNFYFTRSRSN